MTEASGNVWTAAHYNTYVRDNMNAVRNYLLGADDLGANYVFSGGRWLLFKDTDVAHSMTTVVGVASFFDSNTWLGLGQRSATAGGAYVFGASDTDSIGNTVWGINGSNTPTAPGLQLGGSKKNGAATTLFASGEEVIRFNNDTTTLGQWFGTLGLNIPNGLAVGYTGNPVNTALNVGDANFQMVLASGTTPRIWFDTVGGNDYIEFDRANSRWSFLVNGATVFQIASGFAGTTGGAGITAGVDGSGGPNDGCVIIADERTAGPTAPSLGGCKLYLIDNGAGKTKLMAQFNAGAAQQIAIQP